MTTTITSTEAVPLPAGAMTELRNGKDGRWLGWRPQTRGIYRHRVPNVDSIKVKLGEAVSHTMVTSVGGHVEGELIRWVADGEISYEVRINGLEEPYGICDAAAYSIANLARLAKVANDLRYEWEIITGVYPDIEWTV